MDISKKWRQCWSWMQCKVSWLRYNPAITSSYRLQTLYNWTLPFNLNYSVGLVKKRLIRGLDYYYSYYWYNLQNWQNMERIFLSHPKSSQCKWRDAYKLHVKDIKVFHLLASLNQIDGIYCMDIEKSKQSIWFKIIS